jgi:hypothetical protein
MALTDITNFRYIRQPDAPSIKYEGNEGPQSPQERANGSIKTRIHAICI